MIDGDRRRLEQERGVGAVEPGVDRVDRLRGRLRVADPRRPASGLGVDPGQPLERDAEERHVEAAAGPRRRSGSERLERLATRGEQRAAGRASTARTGRRRPRRQAADSNRSSRSPR